MKRAHWHEGNRVRLLENGEEYFPRVFEAIAQARSEVLIETYILFDDPVGRELRDALIAAARRGVRVDLTVDGHGSADLAPEFIAALSEAGVRFHMFDPQPKLFGFRTNLFRRLHRKQVVIDGEVAMVGGINFSHDHVREFGEEAKQDYAVEVSGPVVDEVRRVMTNAPAAPHAPHWWRWWRSPPDHSDTNTFAPAAAGARVALVTRDNRAHRNDIEWQYREALRAARGEVIIANAYFFPGYRLLKDLRNAARRGVTVSLILQGKPDMPLMREAAITLYDYLLRAGVKIYEYCERPLHGKVAVIDEEWATVGSSNLDPLSLSLNLEANLMVRDRAFAHDLRGRLQKVIRNSCSEITHEQAPRRTIWGQILNFFIFHFLRRYPGWGQGLPADTGQQKKVVVAVTAPAPDQAAVRRRKAA